MCQQRSFLGSLGMLLAQGRGGERVEHRLDFVGIGGRGWGGEEGETVITL